MEGLFFYTFITEYFNIHYPPFYKICDIIQVKKVKGSGHMGYGYNNPFGMGGLNYPMYQAKGINGRMVTSIEEARAAQIDLDGSQWYFPSPSEGKIYVKSINMQGMPVFQEYRVHNYEQKPDSSQYLLTLSQRLDAVEKRIKEMGNNEHYANDANVTSIKQPQYNDTANG